MACIECLFIPFGTILGVFTIVVLSRESVLGIVRHGDCAGSGLKIRRQSWKWLDAVSGGAARVRTQWPDAPPML